MDEFNAKLVAAATGSTVTALTMTPFDVVKTRLQTQPPQDKRLFSRPGSNSARHAGCTPTTCARQMSSYAALASSSSSSTSSARALAQNRFVCVCVWDQGVFRTERVTGFADAVRHVWKAEGLRGLWKGAGTSLLIGVPSSTSYMLTYDYLLNTGLPPLLPSPLVPLASGILARSSITSLVSPLELIRTNLQSTPPSSSSPHTLRSVLSSVHALTQTQGVRSLWRGLGPTLWRDVPFSGIYWASYESLKRALREYTGQQGGNAYIAFVSGASSGILAAFVTSPFDVLKTRRQALVMSGGGGGVGGVPSGSVPFLTHVVRNEGVSALFAGLAPRMVKIAPACGIMIACFEGVGKYLSKKS